MGELTYTDMRGRISALASRGEYVSLNLNKLGDAANVMEASVDTEWWRAYLTAPEHYQFAPLQRADADALMFHLMTAAQMWRIWERMPGGDVEPFSLHVGDPLYVGASAITAAHHRALIKGRDFLDPDYLAGMGLDDVEALYRDEAKSETSLPNLPGRLAKFNEIGRVLSADFHGRVTALFARADGFLYTSNGEGLIQLLAKHFPISFGDPPFYKLANILVLAICSMRDAGLPITTEFKTLTRFQDLERLEGGADYYRPLFLMRLGVLEPGATLKLRLRSGALIDKDSAEEWELRANTLQALRNFAELLGEYKDTLPDVEVETHATAFLRCRHCQVGISDEELACRYKRVCAAWNGDQELMDLRWPLVETTTY